jgi:hypothetical protein
LADIVKQFADKVDLVISDTARQCLEQEEGGPEDRLLSLPPSAR